MLSPTMDVSLLYAHYDEYTSLSSSKSPNYAVALVVFPEAVALRATGNAPNMRNILRLQLIMMSIKHDRQSVDDAVDHDNACEAWTAFDHSNTSPRRQIVHSRTALTGGPPPPPVTSMAALVTRNRCPHPKIESSPRLGRLLPKNRMKETRIHWRYHGRRRDLNWSHHYNHN
eukprot:TRINITY_DN58556_c0_g1_i1.p1 TRINITY_DN58556_c0_g1~~TRINITY_DN58556_c0_g1_i1.p1  ORF type:complete len:172 (-),score=7.33 TRINITY_DN58556_c0_g1_i1:13-528(-)